MSDGYDPNKSRVNEDTLHDFLSRELEESLLSVPGIGPASEHKLNSVAEPPVFTSYQLIGTFLSLRVEGMTSQEHLDSFWYYLKMIGITSSRSGIVHAISEKVYIMMPSLQ